MPDPATTETSVPSDEPEPPSGGLSVGRTPPAAWPHLDPDSAAAWAVSFHTQVGDVDPPAAGWIEPLLTEAAQRSGVTGGWLDVTLVDDAAMADLHAEHHGDPTTTDVITFDLADPDAPTSHVEGDLVVCRDEAVRQAEARGHDARLELLLYAVHGLMHLLGEDDGEPEAYDRMHRREDELLGAMGFGPVFAVGAARSGRS
ncbi:MAG: rRNA maturation RNase YbeY [Planctomycetota bacterium]